MPNLSAARSLRFFLARTKDPPADGSGPLVIGMVKLGLPLSVVIDDPGFSVDFFDFSKCRQLPADQKIFLLGRFQKLWVF